MFTLSNLVLLHSLRTNQFNTINVKSDEFKNSVATLLESVRHVAVSVFSIVKISALTSQKV